MSNEREIPEHAQTVLMPSELESLKMTVGEKSTKDALRVAVEFTNKNYRKVMKKAASQEIQEMKEDI